MRSALLCLVMIVSLSAWGDTLYVDQNHPSASDGNPGTSQALPWSTVKHAAATAQAGDTVYVKNGTYTERVAFGNSGTDGAWITVKAYAGHTPLLDGSAAAQWDGFVNFTGIDYVRFEGFAIANCNKGQAVYIIHGIGDPATHIELRGLDIGTVADSPVQIRGDASNILVEGCTVHRCGASGIDASSFDGGRPHHITIRGNTAHDSSSAGVGSEMADNLTVEYNTVHHCSIGLDIGSGDDNILRNNTIYDCGDGIYLSSNEDSQVYDNVVHHVKEALASYYWIAHGEDHARNKWFRNTVYNATWAVYEMDRKSNAYGNGPTSGHEYFNNLFYNIGGNSYRAPFWFRGVDNCKFNNNTVYMLSDSETFELVEDADNAEFRNNIVSVSGSHTLFSISGDSSATIDHNCYHARTGTVSAVGGNDVTGNPKFVNEGNGDFHLQAGSPCINTGTALTGFSDDLDRIARPQGTGWDRGAYEYVAPANTPPTVDAGADQGITLPVDTISLDATVSDPDDTPVITWSRQSGPTAVSFADSGDEDTNVTFSRAGLYVLRIAADDGANPPVSDTVTITVNVDPADDSDGDGMDDQWERDNFGGLTHDGTGDSDGDTISDLDEYMQGSDPVTAVANGGGGTSGGCRPGCGTSAMVMCLAGLAGSALCRRPG